MAPARLKLTYDDYAGLPYDGKIHEIIDGEHYNHPAPGPPHQRAVLRLGRTFGTHVERQDLGEWLIAPCDDLLSIHDVVQPDGIFIAKKNAKRVTERNIQGAPDLAAEVVSLSDPKYDRETKFRLYEKFRVPYLWLLDPSSRIIEEYQLRRGRYKLLSRCGPGEIFRPGAFRPFRVRVDALFGPA